MGRHRLRGKPLRDGVGALLQKVAIMRLLAIGEGALGSAVAWIGPVAPQLGPT